jgi:hypothetical protein
MKHVQPSRQVILESKNFIAEVWTSLPSASQTSGVRAVSAGTNLNGNIGKLFWDDMKKLIDEQYSTSKVS